MRIVQKAKDFVPDANERYFLFTDGSCRQQSKTNSTIGLGADLRDKDGKQVLFYSEDITEAKLPDFCTRNDFEELAVLKSLKVCSRQGIKKIFVQSDSKSLVSQLNKYLDNNISSERHIREIYINIHNVIETFDEIFFEYIPRSENRSADFYSRSVQKIKTENNNRQRKKTSKTVDELKKEINKSFFMQTRNLSIAFHPVKFAPVSYNDANLYLNNKVHVNFDDQPSNNLITVSFEITDKNNQISNPYQNIIARYTEANKQLVLAFLLWNLVTEKSSYPLLRRNGDNQKSFEFVYNDNYWIQFSSLAQQQKKLNKKILTTNLVFFKNIQKLRDFDFSTVIKGSHLRNLENILFHPTQYDCGFNIIKN